MDINLMVVSVGNSRVAVGVFKAGELVHSSRVGWRGNESGVKEAVSDAWKMLSQLDTPGVAGAGVNPEGELLVEKVVGEVCNMRVQWAGKQLEYPMVIRPEDEKSIGADRVCNVAAAYEQMGKACVVVDAGTAITVDVCDDAGGFMGGAIAPGASLMLKSMHEATARLPLLEPAKPQEAIGTTTNDAMLSGVYFGIRGMVKELVEAYAEKLGAWPEVIATGGDAQLLFGDWELTHAVSPDLTLYGIALTFAEHYIKHPEG